MSEVLPARLDELWRARTGFSGQTQWQGEARGDGFMFSLILDGVRVMDLAGRARPRRGGWQVLLPLLDVRGTSPHLRDASEASLAASLSFEGALGVEPVFVGPGLMAMWRITGDSGSAFLNDETRVS